MQLRLNSEITSDHFFDLQWCSTWEANAWLVVRLDINRCRLFDKQLCYQDCWLYKWNIKHRTKCCRINNHWIQRLTYLIVSKITLNIQTREEASWIKPNWCSLKILKVLLLIFVTERIQVALVFPMRFFVRIWSIVREIALGV